MKHNAFEQSARKSGMVRVRGGFSDVNKIGHINHEMQLYEFDNETRILLANVIHRLIQEYINGSRGFGLADNTIGDRAKALSKSLLNDVFCENDFYDTDITIIFENNIMNVLYNACYNEVLDLVEYLAQWCERHNYWKDGSFYKEINDLFEREYVGYRFIDGRIVQITDKIEIQSIEKALTNPFDGCRAHIRKAMGFLADRQNKDYKNSIKESISAVESICKVIVGNEKAVLSDALKKMENDGFPIHHCLKDAFSKLYAYAGDQGGIRHAEKMFESNVTFEEAEFMLVSCSAFVNYLIAEYGKRS